MYICYPSFSFIFWFYHLEECAKISSRSIWRAGKSNLPQFKKIRLSQVILERAKEAIINDDPNRDTLTFILARFSDRLGQAFFADPHPEIKKGIFGNLRAYRFYLGAGYIVFINTGSNPFPHPSSLFTLTENSPLRIVSRGEFRKSKEGSTVLDKVIRDAGNTLATLRQGK